MKQIIFISTLSILCTIYPAHFEAVNDCKDIIELRYFEDSFNGEYYRDNPYSNRPMYKKGDNCVWWNDEKRQWSAGPCKKIGKEATYYLSIEHPCPYATWGSKIPNGNLKIPVSLPIDPPTGAAPSIGQPANNLHPFGPVITVAQTRKSTPKCNFVFTGRWRCNNQRNN